MPELEIEYILLANRAEVWPVKQFLQLSSTESRSLKQESGLDRLVCIAWSSSRELFTHRLVYF